MYKSTLKSTLAAAAVALSCLVPAASAEAPALPISVSLGQVIAAQGNAALATIRADLKAVLKASKPVLPARATVRKVSVPPAAPAGGSIPATAACAE